MEYLIALGGLCSGFSLGIFISYYLKRKSLDKINKDINQRQKSIYESVQYMQNLYNKYLEHGK